MKTIAILILIIASTDIFCQCNLSATVSPSTNSASCNGSITAISSGVSCPPYTYTILPGGSFTNLCPGTYTIIMQDQGGVGCCGTISGTLSIPNSAGINEITDNSKIVVFPNPVSNTLFILTENTILKNYKIEITNTLGQTVLKQHFQNEVDVSSLVDGYYLLKVIAPDKKQFHSKFIKQ